MRVARYYAPGDLRLEDAPEPAPDPGEVKIRVRNCSTCGTDVKIFNHGHQNLSPPRVIGHEIAGEVVESTVDHWVPGDRVQVIAAVPCGRCPDCVRGRMTVCPNQTSVGYQYDGGFAEYLVVPAAVLAVDGLNRVPFGVSFAEASVAEPLACVLNGQELAGVGPGDDVVVVGAGPIGCLHVRLARARGARRVFLIERNRARLDMSAAAVGPDAAIRAADPDSAGASGSGSDSADTVDAVMKLTDGRGADVVITAAASAAAQRDAVQMAASGGRISFFGGLPKAAPTVTLDSNLVHYRELTIVGANGSSPAHNKRALELIASGQVPVLDLITHRLPLDRVHEAIRVVADGEAIKVTIEP